ncbi:MAG: glycosyltransferase family 2 protein [Arenibacter sp.]
MFSVITPTYNREHTLERVYSSLKAQTYYNFHWIIIDDASTDNTRALVDKWINEKPDFKIQYYILPENKGKPYALNYGFTYCKEPITIIADSDDSFDPNTLADLKQIWNTIDKSLNGKKIAAVWTLVKDEKNQLVGEEFPKDFWQVNFKQRILDKKRPTLGEKWHSWRTSVLQEYKMCHNDNSFISEGATWHKINSNFDFLCLNIIHRKYWHTEDGLIHQEKSKLKTAKIKYYTSYPQLNETKLIQIIRYRYYRRLAFEYSKSSYYYTDKDNKLSVIKRLLCFIIFLIMIPKRLLYKI